MNIDVKSILEGVRAAVLFSAGRDLRDDGQEYLKVKDLDMDFIVNNIEMGIQNLENTNPVICEYISNSKYGFIQKIQSLGFKFLDLRLQNIAKQTHYT
jgi:hypothetical protein